LSIKTLKLLSQSENVWFFAKLAVGRSGLYACRADKECLAYGNRR